MHLKHRFPAAALFVALVSAVCAGQATKPAATTSNSTAPAAAQPATTAPPVTAAPSAPDTPANPVSPGPNDYQQPHITAVNPPPAPVTWPLPDRIKWLAVVLLVLIAYVGVWLAVSALRKIERQARYAEAAAQAAADAAKAALLIAENQARAERPWILVLPEPTPGMTNAFSVVATNRGRSPARIVRLDEGMAIAKDESELPAAPVFKAEPRAPLAPILLLPGESASIKSFNREEVKSVCANPEQVQRVEDWDDKIYLFGKVAYADLAAPGDTAYETGWCCWYIHGRQKSGMLMAGPPEYNRHS